MPRELNPELFKSLQKELELSESQRQEPQYQQRPIVREPMAASNPFEPEFEVLEKDWQAVIEQIRKLTRQQKEHEVALQKLDTKTNEAVSASKVRIERIGAGAQRIDEKLQMKFGEISERMASLYSKVTERKVSDQKIEELLGRHNQTIQNFEVRMQQMQKLISEQEMQLVNYRSALAEAKREIERLKRS